MLIRTFLRVREFVMQSGNQRIFVGNNLNGRGTWGRLFRFLILRLNRSLVLFTEFFTSLHWGMRFFETITSTKCRTMLGFFILSKVELKFDVYSKRICSVLQLCCRYYLSDERWGYLGNFSLIFAPNRVKFLGEGASFCHQIFWQYICGTTSVYESINATVDMGNNCGHTNYQKLRDERAGRRRIFISPRFPTFSMLTIVSLDGTVVLTECFQRSLLQGLSILSSDQTGRDLSIASSHPSGGWNTPGDMPQALQKVPLPQGYREIWFSRADLKELAKEGKFCAMYSSTMIPRGKAKSVKGKFYSISRR